MTGILASGSLDPQAKSRTKFHELSYSRLGYMADAGLAEMIYKELKKRGLAKPSEDGVSIPMHPMVRSLILVLLAQILRPTGKQHGLDLQPATDMPEVHTAFRELLGLPAMPSAGHVVSFDLQTVGIDLGPVPLNEVLSFRAEHSEEYKEYAYDLRRFVREVGNLPHEDQQAALRDRQAQIKDRAAQLRKMARSAWKRPASFSLGLAGAVWTLVTGDVVGGLLALGAGLAGATDVASPLVTGAYSYLFDAHGRFGPRPRRKARRRKQKQKSRSGL